MTICVVFTLMELLMLFHLQMHVPTLQLLNTVRYHHPTFHIVLHGPLMHLHCGELVFSHTNAVPVYRQPFQNNSAKSVMLACKMCVRCCTFIPHMMVTFTSTCHVQSDYILHFLSCHMFGKKKKIVGMTLGVTHVSNVG